MVESSQYHFKKSGLKRAAISGWLWNFLIQSTTVFFTALIFLITSRILDPVSFGVVAFAAAVVALISAIMPIAFGEALVQRKDLDDHHLDSVFWLCVLLSGFAYVCLALGAPLIASQQDIPSLAPILYVLGSKLFFDAVSTVPNALLQRRMDFRALAIRSVLASLFGASTCLLLIYLGFPLWGLVMSQTIAPLVSMIVVLLVTRWRPLGFIKKRSLKDVSRFGIFTLGGNVILHARIDQLIFGLLLGPAMLGLFFFAQRLLAMLSDLTAGAFAGVSGVVFATLQSDLDRRRAAFLLASFASASLGFPVFGGLLVLAPAAVPLVFGSQWQDAVIMVQALCISGLLSSIGVIQAALIRYLGEAGWWFRYQLLMQVVGWTLIVALAPFGAAIVVMAIVGRLIVLWPLSIRKTSQLLGIGFLEYLSGFAAPALATLVAIGWVLALAAMQSEMDPWALLLAQIASGFVVYALTLFVLARKRLAEAPALLRAHKGRSE